MYAFISYQTNDKKIAHQIKQLLAQYDIRSFLAHEDIEVSAEWRSEILKEIGKADLFISVLSEHYLKSAWCIQESRIAAFRENMTPIALSIDETVPQGFANNRQSTRLYTTWVDTIPNVTIKDLLPGIIRHNPCKGIDIIIDLIGNSGSFRNAEANFELFMPFKEQASDEQIKKLLINSSLNGQVHCANLCTNKFLPPILESHGYLIDKDTYDFLKQRCN